MKFIAHRGLINGPDSSIENKPETIDLAISLGFDVEVDVWLIDNQLCLGHDRPTYLIDLNFLQREQVWAHAKNIQALEFMLNNNIHCFWHENDERTLTSKGVVWTYPNKETIPNSVIVVLQPELELDNKNIFGVCGDYITRWTETSSNLL
jgi:glycerophosphoryl diester phosphodiesterase